MKTKQDIAILMDQIFEECRKLRNAGQKEYAGREDNAFGNFERLANQLDTTREKVLWTYLVKHFDGILSHINGHISQREPVYGRINDAIVYLVLLAGMFKDNERPQFIPAKSDLSHPIVEMLDQ